MKLKTILLIFGLVLVLGYAVYYNYNPQETTQQLNEKITEVKEWYPESLEDCKKQRAILLDSIKQAGAKNGK